MMTTVHEHVGHRGFFSATKGAPDRILDHCTHYFDPKGRRDRVRPLDEETLKDLLAVRSRMATGAMRVLGFACKDLSSPDPAHRGNLEEGMVFAGFMGIADPPRPDVEEAIRLCKQAGIRVNMTPGAQKETALARTQGKPHRPDGRGPGEAWPRSCTAHGRRDARSRPESSQHLRPRSHPRTR
jgi:Ca2+-transporting ATPase